MTDIPMIRSSDRQSGADSRPLSAQEMLYEGAKINNDTTIYIIYIENALRGIQN